MVLSKENPLKMGEVLKLNLQEALSYLLYVISKRKKEKEELDKIRRKNKR